MNEIFEQIRQCVERDKADELGFLAYLTEETGEVASCVATKNGLKVKVLKETTEQECTDVVICAIAMAIKCNKDWEWKDFREYLKKKLDRWDGRLK